MAPDDILVEHPASETQHKPTGQVPMGQVDVERRSIGPEGKVPGGPEAPDSDIDADRRQPAGERRQNNPAQNAGGGSARGSHSHAGAGGPNPSDPPAPPGTPPPEVPQPDEAPPPIQEPPGPIPVPPNDPPPPIVAASRQPEGRVLL